jgi:hypothetical protein
LRWIEQIYIQVIFRFFDSMSCFSFSQCIALSHAQYIYIYVYKYMYISTSSVYMDLLAGDQVCMSICLFIRLFYLLSFFFLFAHSIQSVKHQVVIYIHIYVYIYDGYILFHDERRGFWRTSKRLFDNLLFFFFLSFLVWLIAN